MEITVPELSSAPGTQHGGVSSGEGLAWPGVGVSLLWVKLPLSLPPSLPPLDVDFSLNLEVSFLLVGNQVRKPSKLLY